MKSSGLRVLAVIVFLLAFAGANVGSFLLGRASAEHNSVSWEEASVFYAQIVERRENTLLVEGLPVNDVNHRGQFSFTLGEDTRLLWRGEEITQHGHFACQTSRIGRRRTERLHDRRCGHGRRIGDDGLRQFGMGRLISGQLLLIFLLLPGTVNRETEKQNPDKYDTYD